MGLISGLFQNLISPSQVASVVVQPFQAGVPQNQDLNYNTFAREGYSKSAIVYACIEELATSAAEPRLQARVGGEWVLENPVLDLLKRPNLFQDGFGLWASVIMYLSIAGNAYGLKVRTRSGKVVELWLLRPDRVRVIPHETDFISHYEYDAGDGFVRIPREDIIHWRKRNPLDDYYGMPPLMAAAGATDLDNYMRLFVSSFFQNAGVPGGLLNLEGPMDPAATEEIRNRYRGTFGGPTGWHSLMIIQKQKATFTPMTQSLGPSGLVVPELGDMTDAEICEVFGVPQSLVGTRLSYSHGGYANKQAEEEHFWTGTLVPTYKEIAGPLNSRRADPQGMGLTADFPGVEEIRFDMADVRALQEDLDKVHARIRGDFTSGLITQEEARTALGWPAKATGSSFLIPLNLTPHPADEPLEPPEPPEPAPVAPPAGQNGASKAPIPAR